MAFDTWSMADFDYQLSGTVHNFGVFERKAKRSIFQINLRDRRIQLIHKGTIKYSFAFDQFLEYESEENSSITVKFTGKELHFDAASQEEKDAICHLLGIVQSGGQDVVEVEGKNSEPEGSISLRSASIIKEGIVEKKGHATILFWSKRRIRITPGMLSYFKPDENVTLNILQLKENGFELKESGNNGFSVIFPRRTYHFRIPSDIKSTSVQEERASWLRAIKSACTQKRRTVIFCEKRFGLHNSIQPHSNVEWLMSKRSETSITSSIKEEEEEVIYENTNEQEEQATASENESIEKRQSKDERPENLSVYIPRVDPLPPLTRDRSVKPQKTYKSKVVSPKIGLLTEETEDVIQGRESPESNDSSDIPAVDYSDTSDDENIYENETVSDQVAKEEISTTNLNTNSVQDQNRMSKGRKPVATPRKATSASYPVSNELPTCQDIVPNTPTKDTRETTVASTDLTINIYENCDQTFAYINQENYSKKNEDSVVETLEFNDTESLSTEIQSTRAAISTTEDTNRSSTKSDCDSPSLVVPSVFIQQINQLNNVNQNPPTDCVGLPPPPPPDLLRVLLQPPPPPPPDIPLPTSTKSASIPDLSSESKKFRTIHWTAVPKIQFKESLWKRVKDKSSRLNTDLLWENFCVKGEKSKVASGSATKEKPKMLLDERRARNLAILLNGIKSDSSFSLQSILSSVQEDERFPAEKLSTIRRCQPTEDDIDMYKLYKDKKQDLDPVDRFMLEMCDIQCLELRLEFILVLWDFPRQLNQSTETLKELSTSCESLLKNKQMVKVLGYILCIGNHMNIHKKVDGFQISSIGKFMEMRGKSAGYTFLHFLAEQLQTTDPDLLQWTSSLKSVINCRDKSVSAISTEIEVMKGDLSKMKRNLKMLKKNLKKPSNEDTEFLNTSQKMMVGFEGNLHYIDKNIRGVESKYRQVLSFFGESINLQSEEFFTAVADFIIKFDRAVAETQKLQVIKKRES